MKMNVSLIYGLLLILCTLILSQCRIINVEEGEEDIIIFNNVSINEYVRELAKSGNEFITKEEFKNILKRLMFRDKTQFVNKLRSKFYLTVFEIMTRHIPETMKLDDIFNYMEMSQFQSAFDEAMRLVYGSLTLLNITELEEGFGIPKDPYKDVMHIKEAF